MNMEMVMIIAKMQIEVCCHDCGWFGTSKVLKFKLQFLVLYTMMYMMAGRSAALKLKLALLIMMITHSLMSQGLVRGIIIPTKPA